MAALYPAWEISLPIHLIRGECMVLGLKQGSYKWAFAVAAHAALLVGLAAAVAASAAGGDTDSGAIAYGEGVIGPQKHETGLASLGPDLFGEEINANTGGISFSQTDLSLPGNNNLPVNVTRRLIVDGNKSPSYVNEASVNLWRGYSFGEWELDLPYMSGTYSDQNGWDVSTSSSNARCSSPTSHDQFQPHDVEAAQYVWFYSTQFWNGLQLNIPGRGEQQILYRPNGAPLPVPSSSLATAGGWTGLTTKDQWHFSCLPSLQSGQSGEGFMALAPDGTKYQFDWMVSYANRVMHGTGWSGADSGGIPPRRFNADMGRRDYRLYPTRIEDRFGNYVTYTYANIATQGLKVTQISASDGRLITFSYNPDGQIASATAGNPATSTQIVTYGYGNGLLTSTVLPDGSSWSYSTSAVVNLSRFVPLSDANPFDDAFECQRMRRLTGQTADLVMTHPSGAQGVFHLGYNRLYRTDLVNSLVDCGYYNNPDGVTPTWRDHQPGLPLRFDVLALQTKTLSGPGITAQTWEYQHQDDSTYRLPSGGAANGDPINGTRTMTVVRPDGSKDVSVFGTDALINEGQLLSHEVQAANGTVLSHQDNTYVQTSEMSSAQFPDWMGEPLQHEGIRGRDDYNRPLKQSVLQQQGVSFTTQIPSTCYGGGKFCFDEQVRATAVAKSSTLGYSRTEVTTYSDNTTKWVLGQVAQVKCVAPTTALPVGCGASGTIMSETTYDPTYAVPLTTKSFGKTQKTMGYTFTAGTQDGTLHTVADGNGNDSTTTLSNWYRGIPQTITYPATDDQPTPVSISASVNDNGWITSVVDENGYATGYGYDDMGRLAAIVYPTGDSTVWNDTTITYVQVGATTTEYGIPGSHWKRTESTGNSRKITYYDGMWRPLVEEQYDTADATNTRSLTVRRYDLAGQLAFQSYPLPSLTAGYSDTALKGTTTTYDALDRVLQVAQDWEGTGKLTTTTAYLAGFKTQVTNPRNYKTITGFMAFDQPTTDWPVDIDQADGQAAEVDTDIARDVFGKPTAITRHNPTGSVTETRSYVYDANQLLCKTVEPETNATIVAYDGANNVAWSAGGQAYTGTTGCDTASVANGDKVNRTYDGRNRLKLLRFPDGRGDQDLSYWPDGLPNQITTYNAAGQTAPLIDSYHYNKRRMPDGTGESLQWPGWYTWSVGHGYDANGHLSTQIYPDDPSNNLEVNYAPNALGQPRQVANPGGSTYVSGVTYWPNGAIKHFVYGNGIVHDMHQNARLLPDWSKDADGATNILYDNFTYDSNGNVAAISDGLPGAHGDRTMVYDALDRLTSTLSPMFGNGGAGTTSFSYDALDNLTQLAMPATANSPARTQYYCYDANWRLASLRTATKCDGSIQTSLAYDAQGNLAGKGSQTYAFGRNNRLYQTPGKELYRYDAQGHRVLQSATAGNILSQYSQDGQLLQITDTRAGYTSSYLSLGGSLVAVRKKSIASGTITVQYQHTDALGTPVAVTSGSKAVVERSEYEPYGQLLNRPLTDGPGFTGHVQDALTGLTYMQQRYYDPMIGRFLSVDPVTAYEEPLTNFNRYVYALDNPYSFTDPDGRQINGQYHEVALGMYHLSIRVTPNNQAAYKNDPRFLTDPSTGERYTTFGAGPELGNQVSIPSSTNFPVTPILSAPTSVNLVSNNNRPSDADRSTHPASNDLPVAVPSQYKNEDQFINAMFSADANYQDSVPYGLPGGDGYNSNSYANGLLQAVGAQPLVAPVSTPLSDHPLPKEEFEK